MNILSKFLGIKAVPQSAQTDQTNVKNSTELEQIRLSNLSQEELSAIVLGDEALASRKQAINYLDYGSTLRETVSLKGKPALVNQARKRIAHIVCEEKLSIDQLLSDVTHTGDLLTIASFIGENNKQTYLQDKAFETLSDEQSIVDLCLQIESARVRALLVGKIKEKSNTILLAEKLKNKDNTAYRLLKTKLEKWKNQERVIAEINDAMNELCNAITSRSEKDVDPAYEQKLSGLNTRWENLKERAKNEIEAIFDTEENMAKRTVYDECFSSYLSVAKQNLDKYRDEIGKAIKSEVDKQLNRQAENTQLNSILENMRELVFELVVSNKPDEEKQNNLLSEGETLRHKWNDSSSGTSNKNNEENFNALEKEFHGLLADHQNGNTLINTVELINANIETQANYEDVSFDDIQSIKKNLKILKLCKINNQSELIVQAKAHIASWKEWKNNKREKEQNHIRAITGLIKKAEFAAKDGKLKHGVGLLHAINDKMERIERPPAHIVRNIEELEASINKLVDWQKFAVLPKKESLAKEMQALIGADMPPDALASKIRTLQNEWKELRQSGEDRSESLWEQFNEAAQKAYEPCKEYFGELSQERKKNLEKRKLIASQLQAYFQQEKWDNANWRHVEKIIRTAKQDWYSFTPVDRRENKTVQDAFDAILRSIQEKLDSEYSANKQEKAKIVSDSEQLANIDDIGIAIEKAKALQSSWKQVGLCYHKDDERLWKAFRSHCEAVFEKKTILTAESKQEHDANAEKSFSIISKIEELATFEGQALFDAKEQKEKLVKEFNELGEFPKNKKPSIMKRYQNSLGTLEKNQKLARINEKENMWQEAFSINKMMLDAENLSNEADALRSKIEALRKLPAAVMANLTHKLDSVDTALIRRKH